MPWFHCSPRLALIWIHFHGECDIGSEMNEKFGYLLAHAHIYTEQGLWGDQLAEIPPVFIWVAQETGNLVSPLEDIVFA